MTTLSLLIALAFIAGSFIVTYTASRIAFLASKPSHMLGAVMLVAAGVIYPAVITGMGVGAYVAPSAVPVVAILACLASLAAHISALKYLK
ncbi:MAG: hypothetical protein IAF58_04570 [Leptolyngbya sp.]|nr:hypothetical protein [Candidatus Melainabacteria bacterium]